MWKAFKERPVVASILSAFVVISAVAVFLAALANIWVALSKDTVPAFLTKRGWAMTLPPWQAVLILVVALGVIVLQMVILRQAHSDVSAEAKRADILIHDNVADERPASDVTDVLHRIGWEWNFIGRTSRPSYGVGIRIIGGSDIDRELIDLCLKGVGLSARKHEDESVQRLQVVIGKPDPNIESEQMAARREYENVVAQRNQTQQLLMNAQNAVLETQHTLETVRGGLGEAQEALKAKRREFAHYILHRHSGLKFNSGQTSPAVTIRYVGHGSDFAIVEQLEKILSEFCSWQPIRDGKNDPALPRAGKFKVVFETAFTQSFDDLAFAFSEGDLLEGISVGKSMGDRNDSHHLVVQVLPS